MGEHESGTSQPASVPKRAETFGGFDGKDGKSKLGESQLATVEEEESNEVTSNQKWDRFRKCFSSFGKGKDKRSERRKTLLNGTAEEKETKKRPSIETEV